MYIVRWLLDIIFPPTAHAKRLRAVELFHMPLLLRPAQHDTHTISLSTYHNPVIHAAVASTKFENNQHAAALLHTLFTTWLETLSPTPTILVPIPLSWARHLKRGHNQISTVLTAGTLPPWCALESRLIRRNRHTAPQTSLGRTERLQNVSGAFSACLPLPPSIETTRRVIICDDVLTTGATLKAARAALAPHLPPHTELICVAWAH